jgi:DNA primase
MATWIDFRELRQKLHFADVLRHYNVQAKVKGDRAYALCPLPGHPKRSDGKKRTPSLSVNFSRNIYNCFGCQTGGNAIEFVAKMEGLDPGNAEQFRQAALKAAEIFGIELSGRKGNGKQKRTVAEKSEPPANKEPEAAGTASTLPVIINAPLDFELKHLDPTHPYLASRGFTPKTVEHFGLGYCSKGMMQDRIAIPVHNSAGQLVGYAGRLVDDRKVSDEKPKYLFPGPRERDGKRWEFHKSELLYNLHRIEQPTHDLIVVEGFASVWWLHQLGWPNAVALMGNSISSVQADLLQKILDADGRLWILTDGDEAGVRCAHSMLHQLSPYRFVRWVKLKDRQQPTDCKIEEFQTMLSV